MDFASILGIVSTGLSVVGGSAIAAAIIPRPDDTTPLGKVFALLDVLAANWANARNARRLASSTASPRCCAAARPRR